MAALFCEADMIPICQQSKIDEDEICGRLFASTDEIAVAFFGSDPVPLAQSRQEEIKRSCWEYVETQRALVAGHRKPRVWRYHAKQHLRVKFGLSGIMLLYYVVLITWMWRNPRK